MKLLKNKKGVTLAELLAVITIMGIIAAIAVPAISNAISRSNEEAAKGDAIAIFEGASIMCRVTNTCDNNTYDQTSSVASYVDRLRTGAEYTVECTNGAPTLVTLDLTVAGYNLSPYTAATFDGQTAGLS